MEDINKLYAVIGILYTIGFSISLGFISGLIALKKLGLIGRRPKHKNYLTIDDEGELIELEEHSGNTITTH